MSTRLGVLYKMPTKEQYAKDPTRALFVAKFPIVYENKKYYVCKQNGSDAVLSVLKNCCISVKEWKEKNKEDGVLPKFATFNGPKYVVDTGKEINVQLEKDERQQLIAQYMDNIKKEKKFRSIIERLKSNIESNEIDANIYRDRAENLKYILKNRYNLTDDDFEHVELLLNNI